MSGTTSGFSSFQDIPGGWSWENVPKKEDTASSRNTSSEPRQRPPPSATSTRPPPTSASASGASTSNNARSQRQRTYRPRQCRICLDTVQPTYHPPSENLPSMFQGRPSVSYESEDGRLISPCKCKGSSKYVHEKCLQEWRHSDRSYSRRTFWQCPTCGFQYRLERMQWGRWVDSYASVTALTLLVFITSIFILGFIADPIINMYFDPFGTIISAPFSGSENSDYQFVDEKPTWTEHMAKGFASMGFLGAAKIFFSMGWVRIGGFGSRRGRGATGGDRFGNYTWIIIILGVLTFVYTVWKGVQAWSKRFLKNAGERVVDVQTDDDDEDEDQ